ncbi:MAG: redoxin domain-containing protein [Chloroflexi bacterium]|nr:redoxin domain-containing protein [Chloroflexota bacterium]
MLEVGEQAPHFVLPSTQGRFQLSEAYKNKKVVLAFYTEDDTPSCAQELASFKEEYPTVQELGAEVVAVSVDSLDSHDAFCTKVGGYPFPLVSDADRKLTRLYDVSRRLGLAPTKRVTYLIDKSRVIQRVFHHELAIGKNQGDVLSGLRELNSSP